MFKAVSAKAFAVSKYYYYYCRFLNICSHSVAVAEQQGILKDLIKGVRIAYRSSLTYPQNDGGAGRKGGRKRKSRIYLPPPEDAIPRKKANDPPFTEIWHNNEPFLLAYTRDVPEGKSQCNHCGIEFPRNNLSVIPCNIVISHRERWRYWERQKKEFCSSPVGLKTTKYYCIKESCIKRRFPYFNKNLLDTTSVELKQGHKVLLRRELDVVV